MTHTNKKAYIFAMTIFTVVFFHRFLIQIGLPDSSKYILDALNAAFFMYALFIQKKLKKDILAYSLVLLLILVIGTVGIIESTSTWKFNFFNMLFDIRGIFRPVIFIYSCSATLRYKDVQKIKKYILAFHLINFIYIVYQYFTLEVVKYWMRGDNLNGFFGIATGGNNFVNALLLLTTIFVIDDWMKKETSFKLVLLFTIINLIIATLIELKAYFVELFIIIFIYAIPHIKKLSAKKLKIICISIPIFIAVVYILIQVLYNIYPWMKGTLSLSGMIKTTTGNGYTSKNDLNRLTFISGINRIIFNYDPVYILFGVGLGTANLNGEFAQQFIRTHYSWFTAAYMYVEIGIIGLMLYYLLMFFPIAFCKKNNKLMAICFCLIIAFVSIYDEASRTEASYILYFGIAMSFIKKEPINYMEDLWKKKRISL